MWRKVNDPWAEGNSTMIGKNVSLSSPPTLVSLSVTNNSVDSRTAAASHVGNNRSAHVTLAAIGELTLLFVTERGFYHRSRPPQTQKSTIIKVLMRNFSLPLKLLSWHTYTRTYKRKKLIANFGNAMAVSVEHTSAHAHIILIALSEKMKKKEVNKLKY